jgi:hypothetical protein
MIRKDATVIVRALGNSTMKWCLDCNQAVQHPGLRGGAAIHGSLCNQGRPGCNTFCGCRGRLPTRLGDSFH